MITRYDTTVSDLLLFLPVQSSEFPRFLTSFFIPHRSHYQYFYAADDLAWRCRQCLSSIVQIASEILQNPTLLNRTITGAAFTQ